MNEEMNNRTDPIRDLYPPIATFLDEQVGVLLPIEKEEDKEENIRTRRASLGFFNNISGQHCHYSPNDITHIMSKFLRNTKLIKKIESDYKVQKKVSLSSLCSKCARHLHYQKIKTGEVLFRIGDTGDKFFFILHGKMSVLKLKELPNITMTYKEYLDYLIKLKHADENYILVEVLKKNYSLLALSTAEEVVKLSIVYFMMKLKSFLVQNRFSGIDHLRDFFGEYGHTFEEYEIDEKKLRNLWFRKCQQFPNAESDWVSYITKLCKPSVLDTVFFDQFQFLLTDDGEKNFTCYIYDAFLYFGRGDFFGDFALDSTERKRNATIRAEGESILAWLTDGEYAQIIAPGRKKEKMKDVSFIYDNFFFKEINSHIFEKHYFHMFSPHDYTRGHIIFKAGEEPRELILLQEGKVEISITCNVVDLHNLIKFTYDKLFTASYYKSIPQRRKNLFSKEKLMELKEYTSDPELSRMKTKSQSFVNEMMKMRTFQLCILSGNDAIGIEEIFMETPYITTTKVVTHKATVFKFEIEKMKVLFNEEKGIFYPFVKLSSNKIVSFLERLNHIKKNCIDMALYRMQKEDEAEDLTLETQFASEKGKSMNPIENMALPKMFKLKGDPTEKNSPSKSPRKQGEAKKQPRSQIDFSKKSTRKKSEGDLQTSNDANNSNSPSKNYKVLINIKDKTISLDNLKKTLMSLTKLDTFQSQELSGSRSTKLIYQKEENESCRTRMSSLSKKHMNSNSSSEATNRYHLMMPKSYSLSYIPLIGTQKEKPNENLIKLPKLTKKKSPKFQEFSSNKTTKKTISPKGVKNIFLDSELNLDINSNKIKTPNELIPQVIKEYYKEIKSKGYSSFVKGNSHNTLFNMRFKKMNSKSTQKDNAQKKKEAEVKPKKNF